MRFRTLHSKLIFFAFIFHLNWYRTDAIRWNGNWAFACDFKGNDLSHVRSSGEECGRRCASTPGCTHFTWTRWESGTCWMKEGSVTKTDAFDRVDQSIVCGVLDDVSRAALNDILATRHGARESGACALPASNYRILYPVALGNIDSLQSLKFRHDLCGQVLEVDCGNGPLNIIINNANFGGGLDLYGSTWDRLTRNQPPGQTYCSVRLSTENPFGFQGPRCFYKPGTDYGNLYYHNVGLLNTNGRIVRGATIDGRPGEHRGDNPYYAFNFGPIDDNKQIVFTFEDGSKHMVLLRDCEYQHQEQIWS